MHLRPALVTLLALGLPPALAQAAAAPPAARGPASTAPRPTLEWIRVSADGTHFVRAASGARFVAWGFNYDHDDAGRLLEDYWEQEWSTVEEDFREMRDLGANLVRVHLQLGKFMQSPADANARSLALLARLVRLAEDTGLHLDLTGLGCYHKRDVPPWYDSLPETGRWAVQEKFWSAIARTCAASPAVFCYDLMNEPILPGAKKPETEWLTGELGGKHFIQRITLDLAGRSREQVAQAWMDRLAAAIRTQDSRHLITVGEIPWNLSFPGAKPLFSDPQTGRALDFVSVHFYPRKGEVPKALAALAAYALGKPIVIEEMFPLFCSAEELGTFIDGSRRIADGWVGFYWGRTIADYARAEPSGNGALTRAWLELFRAKSAETAHTRLRDP
jgi:hypothetical protein